MCLPKYLWNFTDNTDNTGETINCRHLTNLFSVQHKNNADNFYIILFLKKFSGVTEGGDLILSPSTNVNPPSQLYHLQTVYFFSNFDNYEKIT